MAHSGADSVGDQSLIAICGVKFWKAAELLRGETVSGSRIET
jgi:hypothetical protein